MPKSERRLRASDLTWREVDQQVVVLDLRSSAFLELNRTGTVLWKALTEGSISDEELAARLTSLYGIDDDRARRDVGAFIQSLEDMGLLDP